MNDAVEVLPFGEALAAVKDEAARLAQSDFAVEPVELLSSVGRVAAEPILADRDQPPFPRATRDGFAARAADWRTGGLRVNGLLRAGEAWTEAVADGQCVEIMTGAPLPAGLDSVVMVEHVSQLSGKVALQPGRGIAAGENVISTGAEAQAGSTLVAAGTRMNSHGVAVAAACGYASLKVFRRPRVAILATGDELVGVEKTPLAHQIRDSNSYTLAAQVRSLGGEPVRLPPAIDDAQALKAAIEGAIESCDLLLLSGGVSMGKYDLVEPALASLGARFRFTGVRMQPGKPVVHGSLREGALPFFGLPGNPVSTMVCTALFVAPVLAALNGASMYAHPFVQARLNAELPAKAGLARFLPARLNHDIAGASVELIAWQGSGDLASTAQANCFLVAPAGESLARGTMVSVLLA